MHIENKLYWIKGDECNSWLGHTYLARLIEDDNGKSYFRSIYFPADRDIEADFIKDFREFKYE